MNEPTHWVDRLALRVAVGPARRIDVTAGARPGTPLLPAISRRRALAGSAALFAGLTVDTGRAAVPEARASAVTCADQQFKDCDAQALDDFDDVVDYVPPGHDDAVDQALGAVNAMASWQYRRNLCAKAAASRHCGPCETCDLSSGACVTTCEPNQVCVNGKCVCGTCFTPAANFFGIGCDPVQCPAGEECNPATGKCEPTCGGRTCPGGPNCCFQGQCGSLCPPGNSNGVCCPPGFKCCVDVPGQLYLCCPGNCCPPYHTCNTHC